MLFYITQNNLFLQRDIDRSFGSSAVGLRFGAFMGQIRVGFGRVFGGGESYRPRFSPLPTQRNPQEPGEAAGRTSAGAGG